MREDVRQLDNPRRMRNTENNRIAIFTEYVNRIGVMDADGYRGHYEDGEKELVSMNGYANFRTHLWVEL